MSWGREKQVQRPLGRDLLGLFGDQIEAYMVGVWLME